MLYHSLPCFTTLYLWLPWFTALKILFDFAHAHVLLALRWTCVRGQNRPLDGNHVQPRPARDQNIPGSPSPYTQTIK